VGAASGKALGAGGWWVIKVGLTLLLAGAVGSYAVLHRTPADHAATTASAVVPPPVVASEAPQIAEPPPPDDSTGSVAPVPADSASVGVAPPPAPVHPAKPATDLDAEMALLASAQAAIQRGDYATALARLDDHQRAFPGGVLSEERTAARVVALCGAGRQAEARSLASAFLARHPTSPLAPRVRASCAAP